MCPLSQILAILNFENFPKKSIVFKKNKIMEICDINFPEFGNTANFHTKKNKIKMLPLTFL
jgi:hypothetical protein